MNTHSGGGLGSMLKRVTSGASLFIIDFTTTGGPGQVAFTTDFPGKVLAFDLEPGESIIMHKHSFICAEKSVTLDIAFTVSSHNYMGKIDREFINPLVTIPIPTNISWIHLNLLGNQKIYAISANSS